MGKVGVRMYVTQLSAAVVTAALLISTIFYPMGPEKVVRTVASIAPTASGLSGASCPAAGSLFSQSFADSSDVGSIRPIGGISAPGEARFAPYLRVSANAGQTSSDAKPLVSAVLPVKADLNALERRVVPAPDGTENILWSAYFTVCKDVRLKLGDIDVISSDVLRRIGGADAFSSVTGKAHSLAVRRVLLPAGTIIGVGPAFDIAVEDKRGAPEKLVDPRRSHYLDTLRLAGTYGNSSGSWDIKTVNDLGFDARYVQCPLDYLPGSVDDLINRIDQESADQGYTTACRAGASKSSIKIASAGASEGSDGRLLPISYNADQSSNTAGHWYTDAANNAEASKVSAIALGVDPLDRDTGIFALHNRLRSLTSDLIEGRDAGLRDRAAKDFLTFPVSGITRTEATDLLANAQTAEASLSAFVNRRFDEAESGP
ncbi:MAG: hypothetical protein AAGH38_05195, partial [Pseudomonadota bacterium]